jgi:hypothetical protein
MKYDIGELDKAIKYVRANNGPTSVDVEMDPLSRLVIKFTDSLGGDLNTIIIYPEINGNPSKFAEVTKTERLK